MKMSIEVGHGWCGQIAECPVCNSAFTLIRERKCHTDIIICPVCKNTVVMRALETPWVGLIEEVVE